MGIFFCFGCFRGFFILQHNIENLTKEAEWARGILELLFTFSIITVPRISGKYIQPDYIFK